MLGWAITDKGVARRENQDSFYLELSHANDQAVCVVCDGMGGARSGNIASQIAADIFCGDLRLQVKPGMSQKSLKAALASAVSAANKQIYEKARTDADYCGMGTTLVGAVVTPDSAVVVNVGDSRAYHISQSGIRQITRDHSLIEDLVGRGELTREEAKNHPSKHLITRVLGTDQAVIPDLFIAEFEEGDFLLLCSDGLTNVVDDQEILFEVLHGGDPMLACDRLIGMANSRGGPDNITIILIHI
ncbi:MAG: Stp1/IreP family PP2C-type Ser/Thr phosphatase [Oscillospiraceae bacterium]|jgi:protein phosphatase|nr:Stp1/IreP family PP2C-type Ser/Thr phosphatase [Oscillospiraceae bacterium]